MIFLTASANAHYANRITAWLDAATTYAPRDWRARLACVTDGGEEPWVADARRDYPGALVHIVDRARLPFQPPLDHLQAGGFLDPAIDRDDDLIIFTDGDAYLQRPPTEAERTTLAAWPQGVVGLGYNDGPHDTLATEAARLVPQGEAHDRGFDLRLPIYNLGVIVCRVASYRRWLSAYEAIRPRTAGLFKHHAAQQWGLCAALPEAGLRVEPLPEVFHAHGHYPPQPGVVRGRERGRITINGEVALFRHHL